MAKVILPELGEGIEKATVSYWFFNEGDSVNEKDELVELTTDKATFNLPSPCSGVISEIIFHEGEVVTIGEALAAIDETRS